MSSLFIETMAKRQEQERIKNQKVKMANQKIRTTLTCPSKNGSGKS